MIEIFRTTLENAAEVMEMVLNAIALLIIAIGAIDALIKSIKIKKRSAELSHLHIYLRIFFGGWLVVALEFLLAADIVGSLDAPTKEKLIELAAIALIRTFLNYFLGKELKEETEIAKERIEERRTSES